MDANPIFGFLNEEPGRDDQTARRREPIALNFDVFGILERS